MKPDQPSATAFRVAMRRAAHQILDRPTVMDDPIALRIVGPRRAAEIREHPRRFDTTFGRALRLFLVARARCAEDAVAAAVERGVGQYIVLGAGLDTFAYRNPYPPERLRVFEVDFPATQAWKRELLGRTGIAEPASLAFVPVDFERDSLETKLRAAGFRADRPAFFSWLGVSMYLTRPAVLATLAFVARCPPGSGITLDYMTPPNRLSWMGRIGVFLAARRVAAAGEPWRTWFDPEELTAEMRALGLEPSEDLDGAALDARYFGGHQPSLGRNRIPHVITALVEPAGLPGPGTG
jgi:methyltransferase (TIGR00027 family)